MVNRLKLNEKSVREAENLGKDYQIFDTDVRGFSITIYPSGNRAFTLDYRVGGRQRRMTIGRWPEWNTVAARERAKELRRDIDEGIDPLSQKESAREAPRVSDMITRYLAEHTPHLAPRNAADQHTIMHKLVAPDWGSRLVTEITKYDVEKLLNKIAAGRARPSKAKPNNRARKLQGPKPTPVRANRVDTAVLSGAIDLPGYDQQRRHYQACAWLPTKWDWIDPMKDASAEILQIESGLKSRTQAISERGYDAEQVDREIAAERKRELALGLDFRRPGSPAQGPGAASGKDDKQDGAEDDDAPEDGEGQADAKEGA
jgi:hypothetical protein